MLKVKFVKALYFRIKALSFWGMVSSEIKRSMVMCRSYFSRSSAIVFIIGLAVLVKFLLGRYVKSVGKKVNSMSLVNSGEDATLDSIISASTLVAAIVFLFSGLSLEAWLGAVISLLIIKSGFEMLAETVSQILGERNDPDLSKSIKSTVNWIGLFGVYRKKSM